MTGSCILWSPLNPYESVLVNINRGRELSLEPFIFRYWKRSSEFNEDWSIGLVSTSSMRHILDCNWIVFFMSIEIR